jgi:hypothetical protein
MSEAMQHYRALEAKLVRMREAHCGHECVAEEGLLESMAEAWWELTGDEQSQIRSEGPKSLIAESHDIG